MQDVVVALVAVQNRAARAIAEGLVPKFDWNAWTMPPVFQWLAEVGGVAEHEMRRTFNCGVGLILIVAPHDLPDVLDGLLSYLKTKSDAGLIDVVTVWDLFEETRLW